VTRYTREKDAIKQRGGAGGCAVPEWNLGGGARRNPHSRPNTREVRVGREIDLVALVPVIFCVSHFSGRWRDVINRD
jgi:hypothetical protein